jgi:hypothetical protein
MLALCVLVVIALAGAVIADVSPGDMLVLDNTTAYSHQGVYSYKANVITGQYERTSESLFIDLNAYGNGSIGDITYGPDNNLYVPIWGVGVNRYNGYTGSFIDTYAAGAQFTNIAFSPAGKAYIAEYGTGPYGIKIYERQTNGSLTQYANLTYSNVYRMVFGPDFNGDSKADLYASTNAWGTGVFVITGSGAVGSFTGPASGDNLYMAFGFGPDKSGDGVPELFGIGSYYNHKVQAHNGATGAFIGTFTDVVNGNSAGYGASDLRWGPDGKMYITDDYHGTVEVYDSAGLYSYNMWVNEQWGYNYKAYALEFVPNRVGTISGKVTLGDYSDDPQYVLVKVELRNPGELVPVVAPFKVQIDSLGNYSLADVPVGTYDLAFKASSWLQKIVPNVAVSTGENTPGVDVTLLNGDADGDNEVTTGDLSVTLKNNNQVGAP